MKKIDINRFETIIKKAKMTRGSKYTVWNASLKVDNASNFSSYWDKMDPSTKAEFVEVHSWMKNGEFYAMGFVPKAEWISKIYGCKKTIRTEVEAEQIRYDVVRAITGGERKVVTAVEHNLDGSVNVSVTSEINTATAPAKEWSAFKPIIADTLEAVM